MHPHDMRDTPDADAVRDYFARKGYRPCDIPACNCGGFHHGHAETAVHEIASLLAEHGVLSGRSLKTALEEVLQRAARWRFVSEKFARRTPPPSRDWYFNSHLLKDGDTIDEVVDKEIQEAME